MRKLLYGMLLLIFLFVVGCANSEQLSESESLDNYDFEGFSLVEEMNVEGGVFDSYTIKHYFDSKKQIMIKDIMVEEHHDRWYTYIEGNEVISDSCEKNSSGAWECHEVVKHELSSEEQTLKDYFNENERRAIGKSSELPSRKIVGVDAECYDVVGAERCYYPNSFILLYLDAGNTKSQVVSLDLNVPPESVFEMS